MHNRQEILKHLVEFNYFIDENTLNNFLKNWKIDSIYEDEDGIEFFDNMAIAKLKKGISLKSQGYDNNEIIYHVNKLLPEKMGEPVQKQEHEAPKQTTGTQLQAKPESTELKNVTVDITNQTLQMIADAVAEKISAGIKDQINSADFTQHLLQDNSLKKDNETLAKKVEELLEDNKKLAQRIEELEKPKKILPFKFRDLRKFL